MSKFLNNSLISIVVNCYNGEKYLKDCLKSIKSQTYKNWEVIFWDNISNDKSKNIFLSFKEKRFRYFKAKKHTSLYEARNLAILKCKGKIVTFLDTDDLWNKKKLSLQYQHFIKNNCDICYTNLLMLNEQKKTKYVFRKDSLPRGMITQDLLDNYYVGIITVMIKKSILVNNKFNNKFQIIGDFEYFIRLSQYFKFCSIDKPLSIYRVHSSNLSSLKSKLYFDELKYWLKISKNLKKKYNFFKIKKYIIILYLKNLLKKILN